MSRVTQLAYIGIGVSDLPAWDDFMTQLLGCQANGVAADGAALYRLDEHRARFHIRGTGEDDIVSLGWQVATDADLEALRARLVEAGRSSEWGSDLDLAARGVRRLLRTRDPLGLVNEIVVGPTMLHGQPFRPGRPMDGPFVAGALGLGHVVLIGGDAEESFAFYRDLLGLRLTDIVAPPGRMPAAFLRANARHHSLAFSMAPLPAPSATRIQHFMVEPALIDDVGRAQDLAEEQGRLEVRLGRHGNDRTISCYLRTPSGFGVEYGWGALEVDADTPVVQHSQGDVWGHQVARAVSNFSSQFGSSRNADAAVHI